MALHLDSALAHVLVVDARGEADLELVITPDDVPLDDGWAAVRTHAVGAIVTYLRPGGPDPDPWVSEEFRVDQLLDELGWRRLGGLGDLVRGVPCVIPVERVAHFRTRDELRPDGTQGVVVVNLDGEPVARYSLDGGSRADVLARHGWDAGGQLQGWIIPTVAVSARDWDRIVVESTSARAEANSQFAEADKRWRALVREGVLMGIEVRQLAQWAGVTPQRVYQLRDRRR
ncbi:MAG TPA: hypothetical protein PKN27_11100 [Propionibacteriaceae bacterium]|nr:hypothetical protein [Propionibacteriaceae bacterium]